MATEHLSEYLERDLNTSEMTAVQEIKQKVQDKYRFVYILLYTGCLPGLENLESKPLDLENHVISHKFP